jgi:hypothetical protein
MVRRDPPRALRWALFEAAQSAARQGSPDRDYFGRPRSASRACLSVARKLLKRSDHTRRELGRIGRPLSQVFSRDSRRGQRRPRHGGAVLAGMPTRRGGSASAFLGTCRFVGATSSLAGRTDNDLLADVACERALVR